MSASGLSSRSASRPPTDAESRMALDSSRKLLPLFSRVASEDQAATVGVRVPGHEVEEVELPVAALQLFARVLEEMARGNVVTLTPIHAELTTQEAADLLNVSRPYLCKLLDGGQLPHRKVGRHRRVRYTDLMAYKRREDAQRERALEELTAQAQELGMGY